MNKITATGEPATELERLIAELSESGLLVFVFGTGRVTAHLTGATRPLFRGPADRRWWHVELGDDAASWIMDVRVDEISSGSVSCASPTRSRHSPGGEVSATRAVPRARRGRRGAFHCYVHDLYDGEVMRPEKLAAWRALRERYGNRDESRVERGTLLAPAA